MKIGPLHLDLPFSAKPVANAAKNVLRAVGHGAGEVKDEFHQAWGTTVGLIGLTGYRYDVHHYRAEVSPNLMRGSRLEHRADYENLREKGIKTIVDLTLEGTADQKFGKEEGFGLKRIPILDNHAPSVKQVKEFLDFVSNPENGPVYVHCQAGKGRTGVMVAAYRMAVEGWSFDKAFAEAKSFGLKYDDQEEFLADFAKLLKAGKVDGYGPAAKKPAA